jgi:tetratricopeptide (TPR) repeat protein
MHELRSARHLDDFTLLRYTASDLDDIERRRADQHLAACRHCSATLVSIGRLDEELKALAPELAAAEGLPAGDPFARRPERSAPAPREALSSEAKERRAASILEASEAALAGSARILEAVRASSADLDRVLSGLPLSDISKRFALLYALREAGLQIAENPNRAMTLAQEAQCRLQRETPAQVSALDAEHAVPLAALSGQAHLLAGLACNWTGELEKARRHFEEAYSLLGESTGDEVSLAMVELPEAQRRSFDGRPGEALVLARRATATFREMDLEDYVARARGAEAIALAKLDRDEEAIEVFRGAAAVFQARNLWSNYVGMINAVGACLMRLGRLPEARREFARALRSVSRERHAAWMPYIRNGLAHVLFSAGNYREAAMAFAQTARLFRNLELQAHTLTVSLFEIESWALSGDRARALHRLEIFRTEVAHRDALDPSILRRLETALSGHNPDFEELAKLTQSAGQMLRERLEKSS